MNTSMRRYLSTPEPPALGPGPRANVQPATELNRGLDTTFKEFGLSGRRGELIRAIILLWHDHLDAAHSIVQDIETIDGSYLHAILHRREPDYGNARYWFRRVGQHPCHGEMARRIAALLKAKGEGELERRLIPGGEWDAYAFVDVCEASAKAPDATRSGLLREIQRMEFELLLDHLSAT